MNVTLKELCEISKRYSHSFRISFERIRQRILNLERFSSKRTKFMTLSLSLMAAILRLDSTTTKNIMDVFV